MLIFSEFGKIGLLILFSFLLASIILFLSLRLSTNNPDSEKLSAYECGFDPYEDARNVFDVKFYLIAILFLIFDLEAVFFFPWCVSISFLNIEGILGMFDFILEIDGKPVSRLWGDGIVLATPTGSTAYALSAGGPIMHPNLNAMVIVPMFSHSLSSRPLVIDGDAKIDLRITENNAVDLQISCDGHEYHRVKPGQHVAIEKNIAKLRLLHPSDHHYYDTLRIKLGWGFKPQG
jgi:NADH:ubiquinone oxidoreductase subunit 3 (subunit A)